MKPLLITSDFPPIIGGISTVFYNIWRYLPADSFPVLAPRVAEASAWDKNFPGRVFRIALPLQDSILSKLLRILLLFFYCPGIISREKIDFILCGQPIIPGIVGLFLKRFRRIPFQVWVYGGEVVKFKHEKAVFAILLKVLREADSVVVNSEFTRQVYVRLGIPESKMIKITPAVDTEYFRPGIDTSELSLKYDIAGKMVIMTVARLSQRKGHDTVIRALARLKTKFPDLVYLIVGTGPDEKRLRGLAGQLQVSGQVVFCGEVPDPQLPQYYNLCDIHVMPNRQVKGVDTLEGFGLSFIEAGACARPVIGGRSGGASEAVQDGISGFLVDPLDENELAAKISFLLNDKEAARKMGESGRKRAIEYFQWEERAQIIASLFSGQKAEK